MLADAVKPYGGIIMWRSFVYGANHKGEDRVKQAVSEFKGMDGKFRDNVILQSKNGPLDFQPREPYAPIFDNIKQTPQIAELQITQEYLGQSKHLTYLAPMWKEFFGFVNPDRLVGISGVANIGDDATGAVIRSLRLTGMLSADWHGILHLQLKRLLTNGSYRPTKTWTSDSLNR